MKFFHSAPASSTLMESTKNHLRDSQERDNVSSAHRLLITDYKPMNKHELHEYLIQIEKVAIKLMPYANRHQTLAKAFNNRIDEIDRLLIDMQKAEELANDVSAQTEHGVMFN